MTQKSNRGGLRNPPGGRPKKPEGAMVSTSIRLPKDLIEWLSTNTDNKNEFIIQAIREKVRRSESEAEKEADREAEREELWQPGDEPYEPDYWGAHYE